MILNEELSKALRFLIVDSINNAKSGHPGMPLGFADVALCLFKNHLIFNPNDPEWINRDRLILSCGHGSMLLYASLYLLGYDYSLDDLRNFRKLGSKTPGHPEYNLKLGIEATTGALGQGIGLAVGFAIAEAKMHALSSGKISYKTYVIVSDGDLMEGISHEACSLAGHLCLKNLIILYDSNKITIDGDLSLSSSDSVQKRYERYGFFVQAVDGHNFESINSAINAAKLSEKPSIIIFDTIIGKGCVLEGKAEVHGNYPSGADILSMRKKLNWNFDSFVIPDEILKAWRNFWIRNEALYLDSPVSPLQYFPKRNDISNFLIETKKNFEEKNIATRTAFGQVINTLSTFKDFFIAGSGDLGGSTCAKALWMENFEKHNYTGSYINYGVREHAMGAINNGISMSGFFKAYCSTFLVFSDYMKPAIRLSAIMNIPSIFCFTHDSIGVGEDGPTHQPVEQLVALRSIPNLKVIRPADGIETAEAIEFILSNPTGPFAIVLSRQNVKPVSKFRKVNCVELGGYTIKKFDKIDLTIIATGSEVGLANDIADYLKCLNIYASVVSMPCIELFIEQSETYRKDVLGNKFRVFIEAGSGYGFSRILNQSDLLFSIDSFGKSASHSELFENFNFSVKSISQSILTHLNSTNV